jgi:hypothetical protein
MGMAKRFNVFGETPDDLIVRLQIDNQFLRMAIVELLKEWDRDGPEEYIRTTRDGHTHTYYSPAGKMLRTQFVVGLREAIKRNPPEATP